MRSANAGRPPRPEDLCETLTRMHTGLNDEQSQQANARLILLLANHIGDPLVIREAVRIARDSLPTGV
ncbi:MAG: DUF2783 domain-containing protein [Burkholderiales bacterium]